MDCPAMEYARWIVRDGFSQILFLKHFIALTIENPKKKTHFDRIVDLEHLLGLGQDRLSDLTKKQTGDEEQGRRIEKDFARETL